MTDYKDLVADTLTYRQDRMKKFMNRLKQRVLPLQVGNYQTRVDGAVYVRLDKTTAYYCDTKLIAVLFDNVLYRDSAERSGIVYKRLNAIMHQRTNVKPKFVNKLELNGMVEAAIMKMAAKLVDEKLGIEPPVDP